MQCYFILWLLKLFLKLLLLLLVSFLTSNFLCIYFSINCISAALRYVSWYNFRIICYLHYYSLYPFFCTIMLNCVIKLCHLFNIDFFFNNCIAALTMSLMQLKLGRLLSVTLIQGFLVSELFRRGVQTRCPYTRW